MTDKWWLVDDEILGILLANILGMIIIQEREFTTNQLVLHTVWAGVLPSQPLGLFFLITSHLSWEQNIVCCFNVCRGVTTCGTTWNNMKQSARKRSFWLQNRVTILGFVHQKKTEPHSRGLPPPNLIMPLRSHQISTLFLYHSLVEIHGLVNWSPWLGPVKIIFV